MPSPSHDADKASTSKKLAEDGSTTPQPSLVSENNKGQRRAITPQGGDTTKATISTDENSIVHPVTDFVTTSCVIDTINAALEDMNPPTTSPGQKRGFFELQKRMPDGSARKATDEEITSEDMKNKLEQAAQLTSRMTLEQKIEWAQKQRQSGNQLYQDGQYKEAIDIYLTCLVVRDTAQQQVDQEVLILPVMNNLAQCSLQLGWYHKAELFCTLALEALETDSRGPSVAKLYFKRGKARRLRGWYDEAKGDLERAMVTLGTRTDNPTDKSAEQKSIEREFQLLNKAVLEGKKNKKRAQRAMQQVLGSSHVERGTPDSSAANESNDTEPPSSTTNAKASTKATNATTTKDEVSSTASLYHEKHARTHSTIRKRPEGPPPYETARLPVHQLSYWQMYRLVAARVAQKILDIIGEEEGTGWFGASAATSDETPHSMKED